MAVPAEVIDVMGKMGVKGVTNVRCKILGREHQKVITRMVSGPVKKGDILMLKETELDSENRGQRR